MQLSMNRLRVIASQLTTILVVFGLLESVYGLNYKWIPLKIGDKLPDNSTLIDGSRYVGRARHFDEILPAEITEGGPAYISVCYKEIQKENFEILTTSNECEWKSFRELNDLDETAVRIGTASNNEPIFVAQLKIDPYYYYSDQSIHIAEIYLTRGEITRWYNDYDTKHYLSKYLSCESETKWTDASAMNVPNNAVSGGKTEDDYDVYVARLKRYCEIVVGQVVSQLATGTAVLNDGQNIESAYCQILVGEPWEYTWISASDGEIPDYAVVSGKDGNEMSYVARFNKTIGHLTYSQAFSGQYDYEILVMNHPES